MQHDKNTFRHESLQDRKSIQQILKAVQQGLSKGRLQFEDEDGLIEMRPKGLLHLKLSASAEDGGNRLNIRISWQDAETKAPKKNLKVKS